MTPQAKSYGNAFFLTVLLAGLYYALHYLPLPTTAEALSQNPRLLSDKIDELNLLALGLRPVLSGFIVLEVFSLVLPPLNRWRLEGLEGRKKLNRWAWYLTFLFSFINALGTTYLLRNLIGNYIQGSFLWFRVLTILALMGGVAVAVLLARLITQFGVGNGFLILLMAVDVPYLFKDAGSQLWKYLAYSPTSDQNFTVLVMALGLVFFASYLWRFIHRVPRIPLRTVTGKLAWFEVPPFPSSAYVQGFALAFISNTAALLKSASIHADWTRQGWPHLGLELALMTLVGIFFYNWFWGIDLFGNQVADMPCHLEKRERLLDRQFRRSLALLLAGAALFWIPVGPEKFRAIYCFINLIDLLWYFGLFQDLWDQWGFWKVHGPGVEVMEMDNMILASYLKGLLEAEKVPCHFQGYRFRLLMLWLKPLFKVRLLVPEEQVEKARTLIARVPYQVA